MSKFTDAIKQSKEPEEPSKPVEIEVYCQMCELVCSEVVVYPGLATLRGTCEQGHKSIFEGFDFL